MQEGQTNARTAVFVDTEQQSEADQYMNGNERILIVRFKYNNGSVHTFKRIAVKKQS
jgi:hypothetical protein